MARSSILLLLCAAATPGSGAEANVFRTNLVERWITNVIEIRVPANRFANEYHTNWIDRWTTNLVNVYVTNRATLLITNQVAVTAFATNWIPSYKTNWQTVNLINEVTLDGFRTNFVQRYQTNWATLYRTNWKSVSLTNELALDQFQTNFLTRYQTNWKTLALTNWEMVLLFKTNWITRPLSNVVEIEMTGARPPATPPAAPGSQSTVATKPTAAVPVASTPAATWSDDLSLEASMLGQPQGNRPIHVRLLVAWRNESPDSLQLHQWRVEREDGAILCFGQEREFHRELPAGNYKVEVKARRGTDGPMLATRGVLEVRPTGPVIQQKLTAVR
jgi:hypothetical protein